ncbi:MAG: glycosyltransferase, partial [Chloroflexota bacterium]
VNAESLTKHGAAVMIEDSKLKSGLYMTIEKLLENPEKLEAMRAAMLGLRSEDASRKIAAQLFKLAGD